jgi:hypothetical protein
MVISNLGAKPLVLQVPIGSEDQFKVRPCDTGQLGVCCFLGGGGATVRRFRSASEGSAAAVPCPSAVLEAVTLTCVVTDTLLLPNNNEQGMVDLVKMKAIVWNGEELGAKFEELGE